MSEPKKMPRNWRGVQSVDQARELIDYGVILTWKEARALRREFGEEAEIEVVRHLARRLVERASNRLQAEIIVETALVWLTSAGTEKLLFTFLEEFFAQPGCDDASWMLIELALTSEPAETRQEIAMFEMAVAMVCELGLSVQEYNRAYPGEFKRAPQLLDFVATYLLSVSNANSICIRLSLLHYFGVYEHERTNRTNMNRIMGRFGHTVLDHLFSLLFNKRSEGVALQYLVENLPYILEADPATQKIVHETFKTYMLKHPERFCLFAQTFADALSGLDDPSFNHAVSTYMQHLGAMLRVVSNVNHKDLAREILGAIVKFHDWSVFDSVITAIRSDQEVRQQFVIFLERALIEIGQIKRAKSDKVVELRMARRGRRPSFTKGENLGTMNQVTYLGAIDIPRAS